MCIPNTKCTLSYDGFVLVADAACELCVCVCVCVLVCANPGLVFKRCKVCICVHVFHSWKTR